MKRCFKTLVPLMVIFFSLSGCSKDNNTTPTVDNIATEIIGVWVKGIYFVSFAADGSYKAYLGDYFMDSGTYTYKKETGTINCTNNYSGVNTYYDLANVNDSTIGLLAHYMETKNNTDTTEILDFSRKSYTGSQMNNSFIGKTYDGGINKLGSFTFYFQSAFVIICTIENDSKIHTRNLNYCYLEPYLYYRQYTNETGISWYTGGCNNGKVYKDSLYFDKTETN